MCWSQRDCKTALKKLSKDVKKIQEANDRPITQSAINFEAEGEKKNAKKYKRELTQQIERQIEEFKLKALKRWQRRVLWNLLWVIPITIAGIAIIIFPTLIPNLTSDTTSVRFVSSLLLLLLDGLFLSLVKMRFWDESNKDRKYAKIPVPENLQIKLNELAED